MVLAVGKHNRPWAAREDTRRGKCPEYCPTFCNFLSPKYAYAGLYSSQLTSAYTRKLPPNSLIVGLRQSVLSDGHQEPLQDQKKSDNTETSQRLNQVTAASQLSRRLANVKLDDTIDYYYIPTSGATAAQSSHLPGRSGSSKLRSSRISTDDAAALSDPDVTFTSTGSDVPDTDSESGGSEGGGHGGYDSETTYELSGDTQTARPGLNRRRSSNRTIRALKRDRSRRGRKKNPFSPQAHEGSKATSSPSEGKVDAQSDRRRKLQRWQLEREREREVLERSKRETRMLHSYDSDALESLVREQIACSEQMETGHKERLATSRGLSRRDNTVTLGRRSSRAHLRLSSLEEQVDSEAANLKDLQLTLRERREALVKRKTRLELVKRQMQEEASWQGAQKDELESLGLHLLKLDVDVHNRRASMLETVSQIYPIQLMSAADLLFSICGIALPNSPATALGESKGKLDEEDLAAALGLTAQAVSLISSYLETPLHYEIATAGSRAMMRDGISLMTGPRGFPLYSKGVEQYRFEYGVFLLNKDIEQLMNVHGLPVLDLRHLLPNLNNLLLTLSSPATRASEALSGISNSVLAGTSPISSAKRKGYRTAGKGEIVLPSSTQQAVAPTIPENKVKDGVILQGPGVDAVKRTAEPSQAASWTASLLGWGGAGGRKTTPRRAGETETGKADVQNGSRASTAHVS